MSEEKAVYGIKDHEPKHLKEVKRIFEDVADFQEIKGMNKYGKPLDPLDNYDWLKMALEEQVDGTKYLIAEMKKRNFAIGKIRYLSETHCDAGANEEIKFWLDFMEGK